MLRRLRCQVLPKLGSAAGPREAAMGSGRVQHRFNIVPKWVPRSSLEHPGRVLGGLENRLPKGTTSNPEGTKMASGRPPGGFWAPGVPQMAAQAALGPHVGGSCGPLAGSRVVLGSPWRLLGPSWASRGAPRRLAGELREVILERFFKVDPDSQKNHNVLTCFVV